MRIEIDKGLAQLLDRIKQKELSIYGRGHVETVRFLANYYEHHKPLEKLQEDLELNLTHFLENLNTNIEHSLEKVFPKALAQAIANILTFSKDVKEPEKAPGEAHVQPRRGR